MGLLHMVVSGSAPLLQPRAIELLYPGFCFLPFGSGMRCAMAVWLAFGRVKPTLRPVGNFRRSVDWLHGSRSKLAIQETAGSILRVRDQQSIDCFGPRADKSRKNDDIRFRPLLANRGKYPQFLPYRRDISHSDKAVA